MAKWHKNRKQIRNGTYTYDYQEFIDFYKIVRYSGDHTSLPVIINRCQNLVKSKHYGAYNKPPKIPTYQIDPNWKDVDVKVYMKLITYDLFLSTLSEGGQTFNHREFFTIEIDETVPDDMIIVSTLDQKFIESIQILNSDAHG